VPGGSRRLLMDRVATAMAGHQIGAAAVPVLIAAFCDPPGGALLGCAARLRRARVSSRPCRSPELVFSASRRRRSRHAAKAATATCGSQSRRGPCLAATMVGNSERETLSVGIFSFFFPFFGMRLVGINVWRRIVRPVYNNFTCHGDILF
jgi:hypothetical protein